jgi:hypothetical protein
MDPRDDDIDFDFFEDEPATTEAQSTSRVRLPRRGGRGTGMRRPAGPPHGMTPLLRLLAAIVVLVALFVIFGLLIQSCASTSKHDAYASYMSDAAKIAHSSQDDGAAVANALTTAGAKATAIAANLTGIADQERQNVAQAQKLDPPGPLRPENQQLIEALQLRISGVRGLARSLAQLAASKKTLDAAVLSEQADRLLASDVVWQDLFKAPAAAEMAKRGVKGVAPPDSKFVANRQLVTEASMTLLIQRLQGATTGGKPTGVHGTNLVSVVAQPGDQQLSTASDNTVTATTDLKFEVTVEDSGDAQEVGIKVTLTLQKDTGGTPVVQTQKIDVINPQQKKVVTFAGINVSGFFAVKSHLRIDVSPVPGEVKTENNTASYPVIFSLG